MVRALLAAAILLLFPFQRSASAQPPAEPAKSAPELRDLRGVDDLRSAFNQDAGKVRLVLLLSPT